MRSKPEKSNMGKVAAVLAILAIIWLALGTACLLSFRYWIRNNTLADVPEDTQIEEEDESDADDFDSEVNLDDDLIEDKDDFDDDAIGSDDMDDPDEDDEDFDDDDADDEDPDDDDDDLDDDEDDSDEYAQTFTVDAWDGFAAVRKGRGTNYEEVGRLNNGEKVTVTDLENGWYKIASGKWKGYYLHKSSLK